MESEPVVIRLKEWKLKTLKQFPNKDKVIEIFLFCLIVLFKENYNWKALINIIIIFLQIMIKYLRHQQYKTNLTTKIKSSSNFTIKRVFETFEKKYIMIKKRWCKKPIRHNFFYLIKN
ncbi:hypothetical protein BpHYR1_038300 [Brachionus plicatilis]|uniref:Uncharacterized protein n=1 Tax=Brachionus plicatilis TaxID=10195 RepID=A0A3M7SIA5_BRAPC|nr:hypothetical protein BpHYR1_038300 [Brachionus plicatilis]